MSADGHGIPDSAATAEGQFMHRVESETSAAAPNYDEHYDRRGSHPGLTDEVVTAESQFMHHQDQEQHEAEAARKRGITNQAAEYEHEFFDQVEGGGGQAQGNKGSKVKKTLEKLISGKH